MFSEFGFDVIQGEALGLFHALSWVVQLASHMSFKNMGFILSECKTLLFFHCNFVRPQANMVAQVLEGHPLAMLVPICLILCPLVFLSLLL